MWRVGLGIKLERMYLLRYILSVCFVKIVGTGVPARPLYDKFKTGRKPSASFCQRCCLKIVMRFSNNEKLSVSNIMKSSTRAHAAQAPLSLKESVQRTRGTFPIGSPAPLPSGQRVYRPFGIPSVSEKPTRHCSFNPHPQLTYNGCFLH